MSLSLSRNVPRIDHREALARQRSAWASGDYAVAGNALQIVSEELCETVNLCQDERVLDLHPVLQRLARRYHPVGVPVAHANSRVRSGAFRGSNRSSCSFGGRGPPQRSPSQPAIRPAHFAQRTPPRRPMAHDQRVDVPYQ